MRQVSRFSKVATLGVLAVFCMLAMVLVAQEKGGKDKPKEASPPELKKQEEASKDIKAMASGLAAFNIDFKQYPDPEASAKEEFSLVNFDQFNKKASIPGNAKALLVPDYIQQIPAKDPWGNPYLYGISKDKKHFVLICTGSDGVRDSKTLPSKPAGTTCIEDDIIFRDDSFVQWPEGYQKICKK